LVTAIIKKVVLVTAETTVGFWHELTVTTAVLISALRLIGHKIAQPQPLVGM